MYVLYIYTHTYIFYIPLYCPLQAVEMCIAQSVLEHKDETSQLQVMNTGFEILHEFAAHQPRHYYLKIILLFINQWSVK